MDNLEFYKVSELIINNDEYNKLKNITHHGTTRYNHSIKVAFNSYKIAKKLKLDYISIIRAGLLHDFFFEENNCKKDKFISFFIHPKKALDNSKKYFKLNKLEENIIITHMFPISLSIPRYKESILISTVDKIVAINEFYNYFIVNLKSFINFSIVYFITKKLYKKNWIFLSN